MVGKTISHYKILEKLGEGGMGVVYKAQDLKLDRTVALKFLPEPLSAGSDELNRFVHEAKAAAGLTHPNICTIHGIEEADGKDFIVMEFVDGQTLQEKKSSLSMKQALDVGIQIAEGLATAHEKGIVHRDIKPENIMFRKDGLVQIMDFGLAKLRGASRLTKAGSTVGTAGYMSPEQVQGHETDHRSDIFSFGVLLYEMLTGQPPFKGVHETAIAYEIVNVDSPPMSSIKDDIPPELDAIVLDCLEKDPKERCQSVAEIARDLRRLNRDPSRSRLGRASVVHPIERPAGNLAPGLRNREVLLGAAAALFLLGFIVLAAIHFIEPVPDIRVTSTSIIPPEKNVYLSLGGGHIALSPNGRMLAFVARDSAGKTMIWIRPLNAHSPHPLIGTDGAQYPFWSPDSRFIGFFAGSSLKKIEAAGGPSQTICPAAAGRGGSWSHDGRIVFAANVNSPISLVTAAGGTPWTVIPIDTSRRETGCRWPYFLPDGKHFLYLGRTSAVIGSGEDRIYVGSTDSSEKSKFLFNGNSNVTYTQGHLLLLRDQSLIAQPFDASRLVTTGDPFPIAEKVQFDPGFSRATFSASTDGILAYQTGGAQSGQLTWFDRKGKRLGSVGPPGLYYDHRISPDGSRVAASLFSSEFRNTDIWLFDLRRDLPPTRFTFDPNSDRYPVWSPDGSRIAFGCQRKGPLDLYQKTTSGVGIEEVLDETNTTKIPTAWSRSGKFIVFTSIDFRSQYDLWNLSWPERTAKPFLESDFNESRGSLSPDDQWIAYSSNESGTHQIYVSSFPIPKGKFQVSTTTGSRPHWRRDGTEVFYLTDDDKIMAAEVRTSGSSFEVGLVRELFTASAIRYGYTSDAFDVSGDGQRFLVNTLVGDAIPLQVTLVVNWMEQVRKK